MKLNYGKCNYIAMNGKAPTHFPDGTKLKEVEQATYLGGLLTNEAGINAELDSRFSKALTTCHKFKTFLVQNELYIQMENTDLQCNNCGIIGIRIKHTKFDTCNAEKIGRISNERHEVHTQN